MTIFTFRKIILFEISILHNIQDIMCKFRVYPVFHCLSLLTRASRAHDASAKAAPQPDGRLPQAKQPIIRPPHVNMGIVTQYFVLNVYIWCNFFLLQK